MCSALRRRIISSSLLNSANRRQNVCRPTEYLQGVSLPIKRAWFALCSDRWQPWTGYSDCAVWYTCLSFVFLARILKTVSKIGVSSLAAHLGYAVTLSFYEVELSWGFGSGAEWLTLAFLPIAHNFEWSGTIAWVANTGNACKTYLDLMFRYIRERNRKFGEHDEVVV